MNEDIIVGLDIGSYAVRVAVGQPIAMATGNHLDTGKPVIHIIGAVEVPSEGVNKGGVTNIEDAVSSVSKALEQAERLTGLPMSRVWVGINGTHVSCQESRGVVGVARGDSEIREDDVERAIDAARTVAMPANSEILHVLPRSFTVDGQRGINDPVGMTGIRLEVDALIVQGQTSQIKNLTKCIHRTGIDIEDVVLSILATSDAVITNKQKELGVCVINIGASTTGLIVFEEGDVLYASVLPIGAAHITADIAIGLRTSIEVAEKAKLRYASATPEEINKKEEVNLAELGAEEEEIVGRRFIADIASARVQEIFEKVDEELRKVGRSGMLPAGVVLTGGGAKMHGMVEAAKKNLRLPASLGTPIGVTSVVERVNDPSMATAIGLVLWGHHLTAQVDDGKLGKIFDKVKGLKDVAGTVGKWFQSLRP
ncbi:MAG: cell division protein FtsA [Candidatus Uhrbacteria bacterium]